MIGKECLMGEERANLDAILKRIDELLEILRLLSEDLRDVAQTLRSVKPPPAQPTVTVVTPERLRTIDDVQRVFPPELAGMLYFEETAEHIIVRPRQYLGSENFAKIASIVREQLNGEYISAGRESHFRVPRKV
ncbi:hypothetical protein DRO55_01905 [Candidatus Bathyarchaeota archaeon]|nr:MAG: hypothetical protein DRO55_01905 [Candidatus Bathyarchaeota archaeon]